MYICTEYRIILTDNNDAEDSRAGTKGMKYEDIHK